MAKRLYPDLEFIEADIIRETSKIEGKYDVVVSSEVIEHLKTEDQQAYIKICYNLLNENGVLILTTPNKTVEERLLKEAGPQQPIENALDLTSLECLLAPHFQIGFIGFIPLHNLFLVRLIHKYRLLAWALSLIPLPLVRLVDKLAGHSSKGFHLGVIAQRRDAE